MTRTRTFLFLCTALSLAGAAYAYDPVTDFSIASNSGVNGVWSYGQTPALGGGYSFSLLPNAQASEPLNPNLESWKGTVPGFTETYPVILHNKTAVTQSYGGTATSEPDELLFHPGPTGEFSVLRFVVPTTGAYRVQGAFTGRDTANATTDAHILLNGGASSLFTGDININAGGNVAAFNLIQSFTAGDTLDFVVGNGNAAYFNDSTGLKLSVAPVAAPEPGSLALLALAAPLALLARRQKGTLSK